MYGEYYGSDNESDNSDDDDPDEKNRTCFSAYIWSSTRVPKRLFDCSDIVLSLKILYIRPPKTDDRKFTTLGIDEEARLSTSPKTQIIAPQIPPKPLGPIALAALEQKRSQVIMQRKLSVRLLDPFDAVAKWAFGPGGPTSLKAIAYGDFVHQARAGHECFILCRGPEEGSGHRFLTMDSAEWKGILRRYDNFLAACPSQLLFEWDDLYVPSFSGPYN
ncbi:hypothetical protein EDB81DRAFT_766068 [Dactylonectria macrodidyma]|uniref:Uncharacterized protein n=1 Tax=Dactylonectria macrodidyma TaxID=307937 RepID=A0A9P9DR89_9HYPO|nr:hypothetical protein EDB81DRAFT_766068 [Dactylonectria macrodidyma]